MAKKEDKKITVIDANVEGREKAIAEAIRQIDKKYGEGAIMRLGSAPLKEVDVIPTRRALHRHRARHRRYSARQGNRNLRSRIVG